MAELIPNTTDASHEKHVPVIAEENGSVTITVGSVEHPMTAEHHIEWIAIQTRDGNQRKALSPGNPPKATFCIPAGDPIEAVYAYCNLHGLWKA